MSHGEQRKLLEEADGTRHRVAERQRRRLERERKIKASKERSCTSKLEGKMQAKTAKAMAPEAGRKEGRSKEKQQRRVSNKENRAQAERLEGDGVWAHEEVQMQSDVAMRNRHRRAKGIRQDSPEMFISTA